MSGPGQSWSWRTRRDRIRNHLRRHETIAERLEEMGYTTVGVTANPWTHGTGFDRGFSHFFELSAEDADLASPAIGLLDRIMDVGNLGDKFNWKNKREWFVQWPQFFEEIQRAIEVARADPPYFLWVFLLDPHQPYIAPKEYRRESNQLSSLYGMYREQRENDVSLTERDTNRLRRAYRDTVRSTDAFLKEFSRELESDEPVLIVHSDHGEAFGEHGTFGHEAELYEENLHVPLIVHGIDLTERVEEPFTLKQLPRLILKLAEDGSIDPSTFTDSFVAATTEDGLSWAVRGRRWKHISEDDGTDRVHDLDHDRDERRNKVEDEPAVCEQLKQVLAWKRADVNERSALLGACDRVGRVPQTPEIYL